MLNVRGNLAGCRASYPASGGHAWVVDGWMVRTRRYQKIDNNTGNVVIPDLQSETQELVHCNWGWGGDCDGYYVSGMFNLKHGPTETEPGDNDDNRNRDYDWWMRTVIIKP